MRAEIDDVIGSRPVSLADRDKMPISDAVLTETLRAGNIAPFALPHTASYDVTFNGYLIPKGATIWPCLDSVMNDDDMFTDPEHFKPERFLDSEGKRLGNEKSVISFSLGKLPHSASKSLAKNIYILHFPRIFRRKNYSYLSKSFWKRNNHIFIYFGFFCFHFFRAPCLPGRVLGKNGDVPVLGDHHTEVWTEVLAHAPHPVAPWCRRHGSRSPPLPHLCRRANLKDPGIVASNVMLVIVESPIPPKRVMYSTCTVYHMKDYIHVHVRVFWRCASMHVEYITYIAKDQEFVLCL